MKSQRVLVLAHPELLPPANVDGASEKEAYVWKTEYDVITTLTKSGHEVRPVGVQEDLSKLRDEIESWAPDIVFNLLEEFHGETLYAQNVVSVLELMRVPYTGCSPRGMMLAKVKTFPRNF